MNNSKPNFDYDWPVWQWLFWALIIQVLGQMVKFSNATKITSFGHTNMPGRSFIQFDLLKVVKSGTLWTSCICEYNTIKQLLFLLVIITWLAVWGPTSATVTYSVRVGLTAAITASLASPSTAPVSRYLSLQLHLLLYLQFNMVDPSLLQTTCSVHSLYSLGLERVFDLLNWSRSPTDYNIVTYISYNHKYNYVLRWCLAVVCFIYFSHKTIV